ncbi:uncharacterized protein MELLADRAFT_95543 [Melampsora larici-populina 98AG31]|uniref:Uncharacterized protein n=1 Tax=Melampsora larici-populina (strain 98AG31 / pathotype 3-4-7) TaxID=747676 RepID=F4S9Q4_MELLP|nr:uncharacterized protein MELLADRAFT_95543 [Melampsora larici-populina 98AG31]EGF98616.1 hypothetical protein MELLADRAFT_95543 [Melampsora larici-populina 98AG31]
MQMNPKETLETRRKPQLPPPLPQPDSPAAPGPDSPVGGTVANRAPPTTPPAEDVEIFDSTITLENHCQHGKAWPMTRLQGVVDARTKTVSRIPVNILAEARLAKLQYQKTKLFLAAIGKIKHSTLEEELGEGSPTRPRDNYRRFLAYSKAVIALKMPKKGGGGDTLKIRNKEAGRIWRTYGPEERRFFNRTHFFVLAGIPDLDNPANDESTTPTIPLLSPEDEEKYCPIYEELVAHEKVLRKEGRLPADKDLNGRSLQRVRHLAKIIARDGERLKFKYIFLDSSAHTPSKNSGPGWSREYSAIPAVTNWADREIGLTPVFATVAQG